MTGCIRAIDATRAASQGAQWVRRGGGRHRSQEAQCACTTGLSNYLTQNDLFIDSGTRRAESAPKPTRGGIRNGSFERRQLVYATTPAIPAREPARHLGDGHVE